MGPANKQTKTSKMGAGEHMYKWFSFPMPWHNSKEKMTIQKKKEHNYLVKQALQKIKVNYEFTIDGEDGKKEDTEQSSERRPKQQHEGREEWI